MDDLYELFDRQDEPEEAALTPFDRDEYKERKQAERNEVYGIIESTTEKIIGSFRTSKTLWRSGTAS